MEFPILFLGALPQNTPALYSLMNYADIVGGTWYPEGGMYAVVEGMKSLAEELGVKFMFNEDVIPGDHGDAEQQRHDGLHRPARVDDQFQDRKILTHIQCRYGASAAPG